MKALTNKAEQFFSRESFLESMFEVISLFNDIIIMKGKENLL